MALAGILLSYMGGARSCYMNMLHKLQKQICRTVRPTFAASLEPSVRRWNVASLSLFFRYYFGRCSFESAELVWLLYSYGRSFCYSVRLDDLFCHHSYRCYKDVYVKSSLLTQLDPGILCLKDDQWSKWLLV